MIGDGPKSYSIIETLTETFSFGGNFREPFSDA
jgi:hypothetical protein